MHPAGPNLSCARAGSGRGMAAFKFPRRARSFTTKSDALSAKFEAKLYSSAEGEGAAALAMLRSVGIISVPVTGTLEVWPGSATPSQYKLAARECFSRTEFRYRRCGEGFFLGRLLLRYPKSILLPCCPQCQAALARGLQCRPVAELTSTSRGLKRAKTDGLRFADRL
jgi:hypothetical protein